jgi:hypothetical protein
MTLLKKAVTFAAVAGVFALTITVAWAVNRLETDAERLTLVIDETLAVATRDDPASSGIAQAIKSLDNKGENVTARISSIDVVRVKPSATPEIKSDDARLLFEGGIITWEDMAYLGSSDIWQSLKVIDMRDANTLHSSDTAIWVAGTITFPHLKELYLPEGVAIIPDNSFNEVGGAPYLEYIQFPTTLERIDEAFKGISNSADNPLKLVFTGSVPPAISPDAFGDVRIGAVTVPEGLEGEYATIDKFASNLAYIESIDVAPKSLKITKSVDVLSVDVTIFGKSLDLISTDIGIAVGPEGSDSDGKSGDLKPDVENLVVQEENLVVKKVEIPPKEGQYVINVYLDGKVLSDDSKKATVTVTPSAPPGKNRITLHADADGDTIWASAALYRADDTPAPEGVDVSFGLRSLSTTEQFPTSLRRTDEEGKIEPFTLAGDLPDGLYEVTASATSYDEVPQRVTIGKQPVSTNPTDTGGGCSAAVSPLLLIAAAAAMACKSKRR